MQTEYSKRNQQIGDVIAVAKKELLRASKEGENLKQAVDKFLVDLSNQLDEIALVTKCRKCGGRCEYIDFTQSYVCQAGCGENVSSTAVPIIGTIGSSDNLGTIVPKASASVRERAQSIIDDPATYDAETRQSIKFEMETDYEGLEEMVTRAEKGETICDCVDPSVQNPSREPQRNKYSQELIDLGVDTPDLERFATYFGDQFAHDTEPMTVLVALLKRLTEVSKSKHHKVEDIVSLLSCRLFSKTMASEELALQFLADSSRNAETIFAGGTQ